MYIRIRLSIGAFILLSSEQSVTEILMSEASGMNIYVWIYIYIYLYIYLYICKNGGIAVVHANWWYTQNITNKPENDTIKNKAEINS